MSTSVPGEREIDREERGRKEGKGEKVKEGEGEKVEEREGGRR